MHFSYLWLHLKVGESTHNIYKQMFLSNLFGDVKSLASVLMLPIASEGFSNYGVIWFLQALGLLVKAREVPFGD